MPELSLPYRLQAILFVASEPLTVARLAEATGAEATEVSAALAELSRDLQGSGLSLSDLDDRYRLVTAPAAAATVRKFLQDESNSDLSRAALETLAIVAYRGPITKSGIETVRGVASDTMLRNLIARGLVAESGKSDEPGRPALYAVSHTFLQHFGLTSLRELPPVPEAPEQS